MTDRAPVRVDEAAKALALSAHTIRAWIASRKIGVIRIGRAVRIPADEIDRLLEVGSIPAIRNSR